MGHHTEETDDEATVEVVEDGSTVCTEVSVTVSVEGSPGVEVREDEGREVGVGETGGVSELCTCLVNKRNGGARPLEATSKRARACCSWCQWKHRMGFDRLFDIAHG